MFTLSRDTFSSLNSDILKYDVENKHRVPLQTGLFSERTDPSNTRLQIQGEDLQ